MGQLESEVSHQLTRGPSFEEFTPNMQSTLNRAISSDEIINSRATIVLNEK
jgi:hypothetical protein